MSTWDFIEVVVFIWTNGLWVGVMLCAWADNKRDERERAELAAKEESN